LQTQHAIVPKNIADRAASKLSHLKFETAT
jgi:hypothetical protein